MSRPFSLLLIALGIAILGSLVYLHFHLMERQHSILFDYAHTVNEQVIEQKRQEIDLLHQTTKELFLDDIYTRQRVVLSIFTEAEFRLEEYFKTLDQLNRRSVEPDIKSLAMLALSPVLDSAVQVFKKHHIQLDIRKKDMMELIRSFENMHHGYLCAFTPTPYPSQAFQLEQEVITLELLTDIHELLNKVTSLSCYRGHSFDTFFPIVFNGNNYVEAGETITLKMGIGSYSSALAPESVVLIVGNDTVRIGDEGVGEYSLRAGSRGKHNLITKCIITSPLTGEVQIGEGSYTYRSY